MRVLTRNAVKMRCFIVLCITLVVLSGCGFTRTISDAERSELLRALGGDHIRWRAVTKTVTRGDEKWYISNYFEQDGKTVVYIQDHTDFSCEKGFLFSNGELFAIILGVLDDESRQIAVRYYFFRNEDLIHVEETPTIWFDGFMPVKPDRAERDRVMEVSKRIPDFMKEEAKSWMQAQNDHERVRWQGTIDLSHLASVRPLTGGLQLLDDPEFTDGIRSILDPVMNGLYQDIFAWLAENPPIERLSDGSGILVRGRFASISGGSIGDALLAIDFSNGALAVGHGTTGLYKPRQYYETKSPVSQSVLDAIRPFQRDPEYYDYEYEDCCGDTGDYNEDGYPYDEGR